MFAYLSTAWVVPGLIGPALAGWVALHIGWRVVFLGLLPLIAVAGVLTVPALRRLPQTPQAPAPGATATEVGTETAGAPSLRSAVRLSLGAALVLGGLSPASLVLGLAPAGVARSLGGPTLALIGLPVILLGLSVAVPAFRSLTPPGTLSGAAGLPAAVLIRGILTFSFFGPDTFAPLALQGIRHVDAAQAGLVLTSATLSWTAGSWIQAHRMPVGGERQFIRAGFAIVLVGVALTATVLSPAVPVWVAVPTWAITGLGMGLSYSPISLFVIRKAQPGAEGAATSGLTLADTLGTALGAGLAGAFVALAVSFGWEPWVGVVAAFAAGVAGAAFGLVYAGRLRGDREAIPSLYREQLDSVAIITDDEPAPGQQAPGTLLFGLYQGVPRTRWGATNTAIPSKITIFRRPHEIAFPDPAARARRVRSTVLHEVAHHLGIDDATLRRIEGGRDRGG